MEPRILVEYGETRKRTRTTILLFSGKNIVLRCLFPNFTASEFRCANRVRVAGGEHARGYI